MMVAVNVAAIAINIVGVKQCFKEGTLVVCLNENGEEVQVCRRFWGEKTAGSVERETGGFGKSPGDFLSRSEAPGLYTNA